MSMDWLSNMTLGAKGTLMRTFIAAGVVAAGAVALHAAVAALDWTINKPPMPLRQPLTSLTKELGVGVLYRAEATGSDRLMDEASLEVLGTRDYLLREFLDQRKIVEGEGVMGAKLMVNINYYASGSSSPHVPDVCWQASGRERHPSLGEREFLLTGVHHADGTVSDVKMRMLSFLPTTNEWSHRPQGLDDDAKYLRNVAYTFNVNGIYVANRHEVESQFWKPTNKHAYHAKIEVTVPVLCAPDRAQPVIEEFMRLLLPEVEKCLPIPDSATGAAAVPPGSQGSTTEPSVPTAP